MAFIWQELIDRARVYLDDDHVEDGGWIASDKWMNLANVEYRRLYRNWVRSGLITPAHTVASFTGSTTSLADVLCIVGVAENLGTGSEPRVLDHGDQRWGALTGKSTEWTATGAADTLQVTLYPADAAGSYIARFIPRPAWVTDPNASVDLPDGGDERLVLGMARRGMIKESAASRAIDREIIDADAELAFTAWGRKDREAPRVRVNPPRHRRRLWAVEPLRWVYFP